MSRCPVCDSAEFVETVRRDRLPAMQNYLHRTRESAIAAPQGQLSLAVCRTCGFAWNRTFDSSATQEVLERAVARLCELRPGLVIAGSRNGYFDEADDPEVIAEIREARADILFAAIPSPKKEYWLAAHREELGVPFVMGVGGAIDASRT